MHYTTSCNTQSSAPDDGRDHRPKHVELIGIINKQLLLHLVGVYVIYIIIITLLLYRAGLRHAGDPGRLIIWRPLQTDIL